MIFLCIHRKETSESKSLFNPAEEGRRISNDQELNPEKCRLEVIAITCNFKIMISVNPWYNFPKNVVVFHCLVFKSSLLGWTGSHGKRTEWDPYGHIYMGNLRSKRRPPLKSECSSLEAYGNEFSSPLNWFEKGEMQCTNPVAPRVVSVRNWKLMLSP